MATLRALRREDSSTRARVIDAAISCIVEEGYYRATSNEIARRAGVSWGVIQYHFRTREALLLAVLRDAAERLAELVESADITGVTTEERLARYLQTLAAHYGQPSYLASLQIILNLSRDPATSAETAQALADIDRRITSRLYELQGAVVGSGEADPELEALLFHACRGLALSHLVLDSTRPASVSGSRQPHSRFEDQAPLLVKALSSLVKPKR